MKVLYESESEFNDFTVTREGDIVSLWSKGSVRQSAVNVKSNIPFLEYARKMILSLSFCRNPKSILVIGLGAGAIPSMLRRIFPNAGIDVIEIDFEAARIANKFFKFDTNENMRLYIGDGMEYINSLVSSHDIKNYEIIIMDAYLGNRQPAHFNSAMFYAKIQKILSPEGIYVSNQINAQDTNCVENIRLMRSVFRKVSLLRCKNSSNVLAFCTI